jgi:hypothetical protein
MLLSIDKVLQLISTGKDVSKIAELAGVTPEDVCAVIEEARMLLSRCEKDRSRKKIIIRKKNHAVEGEHRIDKEGDSAESDRLPRYLDGAEFSAVPVEDTLIMNIAVTAVKSTIGVAIVIHDHSERQVGKLSYLIHRKSEKESLLMAVERGYEIACYFRSHQVRFRIHDDILVSQLNGDIHVQDQDLKKMIDAFAEHRKKNSCRFRCEAISAFANEKAVLLSQKAHPSQ